jgi:PAS domain S-box-containing protein
MPDTSEKEIVILHVEDNPLDRELVFRTLQLDNANCRILTCETRAEFEDLLAGGEFSLLLVDYHLPDFSGKDALEIARQRCPNIPFIFLSGVLGEEAAIDSLQSGATDYVLKQRLERLAPAVRRALREAAQQRQREAAEQRFRVFMDNLPGLAFIKDGNGNWLWLSRRWGDILPSAIDDFIGTNRSDFLPPDTAAAAAEIEKKVIESGMPADTTEEFGPPNDPARQWLVTRFLVGQANEAPLLGGVAFDITARVLAERELSGEKDRLQRLVDQNLAILADQETGLV